MAEDHRSRGLPQQRSNQADDHQYPPIAGSEEDDRSRGIPYHPRPQMATAPLTLPSIQDPHGAYGSSGGRGWEPRAGSYGPSPASTNGYPPPGSSTPGTSYSPLTAGSAYPPPGPSPQYLPPVQPPPQDSRGSYPPDPRAPQYYAAQRQPVPYNDPYGYVYRPDRGPPGAYPADYPRAAPGGAAVMQQSAPRQRTSIACRYCRRRKVSFEKLRRRFFEALSYVNGIKQSQIRCSGYQNSPGGKCTNCIKMNQECIFQPVSSSSSTAFVPVSALQNGIPPGTPLYGAYGQPLSGPANAPPSSGGGGSYPAVSPPYDQPLPSPTGSFGSFTDDRGEAGRRRQRPSDDDPGMRLPPPNTFPEDGSRRRSPSSSSPGHLSAYQQLPPSQPHHGYDNRTPPPRGSPSGPPPGSSNANSVMSLGNIMDTGPSTSSDIDRSMLGRLNRRT